MPRAREKSATTLNVNVNQIQKFFRYLHIDMQRMWPLQYTLFLSFYIYIGIFWYAPKTKIMPQTKQIEEEEQEEEKKL